jgi:hypothetical protein
VRGTDLSAVLFAAMLANQMTNNLIGTMFGPPPPPVAGGSGAPVGGTIASTGLTISPENMQTLVAMASGRAAPYLGINGQPLQTPRNAWWRWDPITRQYVRTTPTNWDGGGIDAAPDADAGPVDAAPDNANCDGYDGGPATWWNRCPNVPPTWQNTMAQCMAPFGAAYDPTRFCVNQYLFPILGVRVCPRDFAQGCITPRVFAGMLFGVHQLINCLVLQPIGVRNMCLAQVIATYFSPSGGGTATTGPTDAATAAER